MHLIVMLEDDAATRTLWHRCASQRLNAIAKSIGATHALKGATRNVGAVAMQTVCGELEAEAEAGSVPGK